MSNALNSTGRNFTYSLCNWGDGKHLPFAFAFLMRSGCGNGEGAAAFLWQQSGVLPPSISSSVPYPQTTASQLTLSLTDKPWEWASTISNSARISGDIYDSFLVPSTSCPCSASEYYCQLPGYGCSVMNILGKASFITSKNQPGYWNDLDMLEVGNGGMSTAEYRTHMTMWAAIKSPLIMGNKLDELSVADYQILTNPAILALSQDPVGSAIQRKAVLEMGTKDEYGWAEVQVWSGSLYGGDYVVVFLNAANESQSVSVPLWQVFGLPTAEQALENWEVYDLWGANVTMSEEVAGMVLNGTMELGGAATGANATVGNGTMVNETSVGGMIQGYYNATEISWAEGIMANDTRLLGSYEGMVSAGGMVQAQVDAHDVKAWRFRSAGKSSSNRKDEL